MRRPDIKLGHGGDIHRHSAFSLLGRGTDDKLMTQGRERRVEGSSDELRKGTSKGHCLFPGTRLGRIWGSGWTRRRARVGKLQEHDKKSGEVGSALPSVLECVTFGKSLNVPQP